MRDIQRFVDELARFHSHIDRLMESPFLPIIDMSPHEPTRWRPAIDMIETPEEILVTAELAGVDEKSIELIIEGRILGLRGIRERETWPDRARYRIMEISFGRFERVIRLPEAIRTDAVEAQLTNGFLKVTLKKLTPEPQVVHRVSVTIR